MSKFVILIDGAFAIYKLQANLQRFPNPTDVSTLINSISANRLVANLDLLRTYFYHANPANSTVTNPIDGNTTDLSKTPIYFNNKKLIQELETAEGMAVRLGETFTQGWKLGQQAVKHLGNRGLVARDLVPDIKQKGVDLRIGLDIARLSLKGTVDAIVVVTGDSDLTPAFKFARREGVRIYLNHLGHGVRRELKIHIDGSIP